MDDVEDEAGEPAEKKSKSKKRKAEDESNVSTIRFNLHSSGADSIHCLDSPAT